MGQERRFFLVHRKNFAFLGTDINLYSQNLPSNIIRAGVMNGEN